MCAPEARPHRCELRGRRDREPSVRAADALQFDGQRLSDLESEAIDDLSSRGRNERLTTPSSRGDSLGVHAEPLVQDLGPVPRGDRRLSPPAVTAQLDSIVNQRDPIGTAVDQPRGKRLLGEVSRR